MVLNQPKVTILEEFRDLFPKQTASERKKLQASILRERKCRDKIIVWKTLHEGEEKNIVLDGHNRHEICSENGISYEIEEMHFDNADEAKLWMIMNQYGRRNLSPFQRAEIALQCKDSIVKQAEKNRKAGVSLTSGEGVNTARELGKVAGVSRDAMNKIMYIFEHGTKDKIDRLRKGETGITINSLYKELKKLKEAEQKAKEKDKEKDKEKGGDTSTTKKTRKIKLVADENTNKLRKIFGNKLSSILKELEEFGKTLEIDKDIKKIGFLSNAISKLAEKV